MDADTLIIGGGLSGLALARALRRAGHDAMVVEARERLGGRILSETVGGAGFDLGPAWFWPGQPRIAALIEALGLRRFDQCAAGAIAFEDETGAVRRGRGFASMEGSYRLEGGLGAVVDALTRELDAGAVVTGRPVQALRRAPEGVVAETAAGALSARRAVLALPPRLAAERIVFSPAPPLEAMRRIPTWMAGQAKAVAIYDRPFWREAGLSGDAMSRRGPMGEIHDASPAAGGPYALFGFIGVPPSARRDQARLRRALQEQLTRLFGAEAAAPRALLVKDWAQDPDTAAPLDQRPLAAHPPYGSPPALTGLWDGTLRVSGAEMAAEFGGYLEGALEAAEATFGQILADDERGEAGAGALLAR